MEGNFSRRLKQLMAWPDWPRSPLFYDRSTSLSVFISREWSDRIVSGSYLDVFRTVTEKSIEAVVKKVRSV